MHLLWSNLFRVFWVELLSTSHEAYVCSCRTVSGNNGDLWSSICDCTCGMKTDLYQILGICFGEIISVLRMSNSMRAKDCSRKTKQNLANRSMWMRAKWNVPTQWVKITSLIFMRQADKVYNGFPPTHSFYTSAIINWRYVEYMIRK